MLNSRFSRIRCYSGKRFLSVVFFGTTPLSFGPLKKLIDLKSQGLVSQLDVICRSDSKVGRGLKKTSIVPIKEHFVLNPAIDHWFEFDDSRKLNEHKPFDHESPQILYDLGIVVSFGHFISSDIIQRFKYGGLNVHPSILPKYRGASPIQRAILAGDVESGITIQTLDPHQFDHGNIIAQKTLPLPQDMTSEHVENYYSIFAADLLQQVLTEKTYMNPSQNKFETIAVEASLARKVTINDRRLNLKSSTHVLNQMRAVAPLWAITKSGDRIKLLDVQAYTEPVPLRDLKGKQFIRHKKQFLICCENGDFICVNKLSFNSKIVSGKDFIGTYNHGEGGHFE